MEIERFVSIFPRLYHMSHKDALPGILQHGLLSTTALLDLYEVERRERAKIEFEMRRSSIAIRHPKHGRAVIRDQKPIGNDARLETSLGGKVTAKQFHQLLNSMVFFWVNPERLEGLRHAKAYRGDAQLVLTLDTRKVVGQYVERMFLCPMNSGACMPIAHPRSIEMFQRIQDYDYEFWRRRKGGAEKSVVECTIQGGLLDTARFIVNTEIVVPGT